jgi:protein SCO1/2
MNRTALTVALVVVVVAGAACRKQEPAPPRTASAPVGTAPSRGPVVPPAPRPVEVTPARALPSAPLYDLELHLVDQAGQRIGLDVHRGSPVIVTMFYASCPAACPRLIDDILAVEAGLPEAERQKLRVLLVSFDPARDTPAALTKLAEARGLDLSRWRLAAAPEREARELAAVLGIKYRRLDDGEYFHTSVLTLLDDNGVPRASGEGLGRAPAVILAAMK